jgi:hypothetical protein
MGTTSYSNVNLTDSQPQKLLIIKASVSIICLICSQILKVDMTIGLSFCCLGLSLLAWHTKAFREKSNMNGIPFGTTEFRIEALCI